MKHKQESTRQSKTTQVNQTEMDFVNGVGFGGGDGTNPPLWVEEDRPEDWTYLRFTIETEYDDREDLKAVGRFSFSINGEVRATLLALHSITLSQKRTLVGVCRAKHETAQQLLYDFKCRAMPGVMTLSECRPPEGELTSHLDESAANTYTIQITEDVAPVMTKILRGLRGALGDDYQMTSYRTAEGGVILIFRLSTKTAPERALLRQAVERLQRELDGLGMELNFTSTMDVRESSATVTLRIRGAR